MNKSELIDAIALESGLPKLEAKKALDAFISTVGATLKKGENIAMIGFGSFSVTKREAKTGRNPQTGKPLQIPAKNVIRFKPGSELSSSVN